MGFSSQYACFEQNTKIKTLVGCGTFSPFTVVNLKQQDKTKWPHRISKIFENLSNGNALSENAWKFYHYVNNEKSIFVWWIHLIHIPIFVRAALVARRPSASHDKPARYIYIKSLGTQPNTADNAPNIWIYIIYMYWILMGHVHVISFFYCAF